VAIVAAELLGATRGLGFMIQQSRGIYRTDIIIVGMLAIGICGGILTTILTFIANALLKGRR
jgi:NitT/TauT family transport system permease protein/taurine transport system permease protein